MVALRTPDIEQGWKAANFTLQNTVDGSQYSMRIGAKGLVVMFICNHCPYVQSIIRPLVRSAAQLQEMGFEVVAISANDTQRYSADGPDNMSLLAQQMGFSFPYLYDESQEVAREYGAVCTPDFFGFNAAGELQYRGRFDASETTTKQDDESELLPAMQLIAETGKGPAAQHPSIGCSIKWKD